MERPLFALALLLAPLRAGWSSVPSAARLNSACGLKSSPPSPAHTFSALAAALLSALAHAILSALECAILQHPRWSMYSMPTLSWFWGTPSRFHAVQERPHWRTPSPMLAAFSASSIGHPDVRWPHCQHRKTPGVLLALFLKTPWCRLASSALWRGVGAPAGASLQRRCWCNPSAFSAFPGTVHQHPRWRTPRGLLHLNEDFV